MPGNRLARGNALDVREARGVKSRGVWDKGVVGRRTGSAHKTHYQLAGSVKRARGSGRCEAPMKRVAVTEDKRPLVRAHRKA